MTAPTILAIDDDSRSRSAIENLLAHQEWRLEFADNGPEGLVRARELLPDLILLDVMMPGMDGFEVCKTMRADSELNQVPIIMLTALDDSDSRLEGLNAGADDFVSKPFVRKEVLAKIKTILELSRYRHARAENSVLQWVLNQSTDGYLVLYEDNRIGYANKTARAYLGLTEDELPEQDLFDILSRQYESVPAEAWSQWSADSELSRYLVRPETENSQAFWLQFEELPEYQELEKERVICLREVTEQINTSTDIRKFHKTLIHKFHTPLSGLWGGVRLLKQEMNTAQADDSLADLVDLIAEGAERLKKEIDEIIDYTFAESIDREGGNFCFNNLAGLLTDKATELNIAPPHLSMKTALATQSTKLSHKTIGIIVAELLENAKKFHPRHTPSIDVALKPGNNGHIIMQFRDDGIELSPLQLKWALMPYIQGEKFFTGEIDGMGLGLPLVSTLVWQSGGDISLNNRNDGKGLEVNLKLPLVQ